ncbi:MAG: isoprenylcysteine carboxylmethyltransferase family protein [Succinivibrionaceae bacterium]|nr:isoprenylcysteine carboxylmethyltransferase family protein [Succinivibrionaceae bacterium]
MLSRRDWVLLVTGGLFLYLLVPLAMQAVTLKFPLSFLPEGSRLNFLVGTFTSAVGMAFSIWAVRTLILRGGGSPANLGPLELSTPTKRLVTTGPYALCRNPIHFGMMLYYTGLACCLNSMWALLAPVGMVAFAYALAMLFDEPRLRRDFGDEYERWASVTPRFWPRVYRGPAWRLPGN